jgi:S1-C subfamily serine protease
MSKRIQQDIYIPVDGIPIKEFSLNTDLLDWKMRFAQVMQKDEDPIKEIIQKNIAAACTIIVYSDKQEWTGSGFHVGKSLIITASHVVPNSNPMQVLISFDGKLLYKAKLIVSDETIDVSVLQLEEVPKNISSVQLGDSDW